ncbi:MAG TPA: hypothetical protein VEV45_04070, partial [Streptosporangiaceae bacterium]|nr:hypothetical protein [Streptosporangiaceae bacterium]
MNPSTAVKLAKQHQKVIAHAEGSRRGRAALDGRRREGRPSLKLLSGRYTVKPMLRHPRAGRVGSDIGLCVAVILLVVTGFSSAASASSGQ